MKWALQEFLWKFLPADRSINFTAVVIAIGIAASALVFLFGHWSGRRRVKWAAVLSISAFVISWPVSLSLRPVWLKVATRSVVPNPSVDSIEWEIRATGLETAEVIVRADHASVDRLFLVRINPRNYRFTMHWDPSASRTAEEWQRKLGAAVVVSGSYFGGKNRDPLTPIRMRGRSAGPLEYESTHGAFVSGGNAADIIDLKNHSVAEALQPYSEAVVSYPLLVAPDGENRAVESRTWLASRNFVAIDRSGRVVLGTTQTGFFTLHRLGEFLKSLSLDLKSALNFDGGPLVSQVVETDGFSRRVHGKAEISNGNDALRALWHSWIDSPWTLPLVVAVTSVEQHGSAEEAPSAESKTVD